MEKIVFFEIEKWEESIFEKGLNGHTVVFSTEKLNPQNTKETDATVLSIFVNSQLTQEVLSQFSALKLIVTRSVGYDHIDIDYCKSRNITVCNIPSYGPHTIAEHTFALLLALSRKIIPSVEKTKRGDFRLDGLRGFELFNKTIGVIGTGNIGNVVIDLAFGFGMKVLVYSRHPDEALKSKGVTFTDLDSLLGQSDVITFHVPLTPQTTHMLNMQNIEKVKPGAILLNTARGGIIETEAIIYGLEKGILRGAGLDVLEEECYLKEEHELLSNEFLQKCDLKTQLLDHVLLQHEQVVVTPHNAFNSDEALKEIIETTEKNILAFLAGKPLNVVNG